MAKVTVARTGKTWGVFKDGVLVEGGFFAYHAALTAANDWSKGGAS